LKNRLDSELVRRGLARSRENAADLIESRGARVFRLDIQDIAKADSKKVDMGDQSSINKVIGEVISEAGTLHAVVNSAGIAGPTSTKPIFAAGTIVWRPFVSASLSTLFPSTAALTSAITSSVESSTSM